jgi:hypothetical protein
MPYLPVNPARAIMRLPISATQMQAVRVTVSLTRA